MIFQYNDIIQQRFAVVKFLNKSSLKKYSETLNSEKIRKHIDITLSIGYNDT